MPDYTVRQGDCVESIAQAHGLFWETIWNDAKNAELRKKRDDPNVLLPGDVLFVPEKRLKEETRATDQRHRFKRKGVPSMLRIVLRDEDDKPRAGVAYVLTIDGQNRRGTTNGDGLLEEPIPPNAKEGKLIVGEGEDAEEYELELGRLDPVDDPAGAQARLANLGYDVGPIDGTIGPRTRGAIQEFQRDHGLKATGELDETTQRKLQEVHGS